MNRDSIKKMMELLDDPGLRQKMGDVEKGLDTVRRMKDQRLNPEKDKIRTGTLRESMSPALVKKAELCAEGIGLILTGGGGKGSFQAGALKALSETDLAALTGGRKITGVAGTSAGALNAVLYAGGKGDQAAKMWSEIEEDKIEGENGFFSGSDDNDRYLRSLIRKSGVLGNIDMDSLLAVVTALDSEIGYPRDFILNELSEETKEKCLMASAAVPMAFGEQKIKGKNYMDGGIPLVGSNMPIYPLYQMGFRSFLVIHCCSVDEAREFAGLTKFMVDFNKERYFNGAAFVHVFSEKNLGSFLGGTINFSHDYMMKNILQGYEDFMKGKDYISILADRPGSYDEIHMIRGKRYRSYHDFLDGMTLS